MYNIFGEIVFIISECDLPSGRAKLRGRSCFGGRGSPGSRGAAPEGVLGVGRVAAVPCGRLRDDGVRRERLLGALRALSHLFYAAQHG